MSDSVVMMVTWRRLELTKKSWISFAQTGKPINLVVLDQGSDDGTVDWLRTAAPRDNIESFTLIKYPKNKGIGYGRAAALWAAKKQYPNTNYFSTIDNDCILPVDWLLDICDVLDITSGIGMCGVSLESIHYPLTTLRLKDGYGIQVEQKIIGTLGGACMAFTRKTQERIGYFNWKDYPIYSGEDADLSFRAKCLDGGKAMLYLREHGIDLNPNETGPYRKFKDRLHKKGKPIIMQNINDYASGKKPLFLDFDQDQTKYMEKLY